MAKMMNMIMGIEPSSRKTTTPKIAVISAVGPISTGTSKSDLFGDESLGSTTIIKAVQQATTTRRSKQSSSASIVPVEALGQRPDVA